MYEHQLICEYPETYWLSDELVYRIATWCSIVGITDPPDQTSFLILKDVIRNDFRAHSFAEIELALKMCALDEFLEPIEAYNKLNVPFLGKVMKHYRKFRKDAANKYEEIKFRLQRPVPVVPEDYELDLLTAQQLWDDYIRIVNNIDVIALSHKYELLQKLGIVPSEETIDIKNGIINRIRDMDLDSIWNKDERRRIRDYQNNYNNLNIHADNESKHVCYMHWLKSIKDKKTTFEEFQDLLLPPLRHYHGKTIQTQ